MLFIFQDCDKSNVPQLMNIEIQLRKCCNHPFMIEGVEDKEVPETCTWNEYYKTCIAVSFWVKNSHFQVEAVGFF